MKPSLRELEDFFRTANWPQVLERRPTFFSIAGFPHYENVISNVYQFFFSTASPHGLGNLCIEALLDVVGEAKKRNGQKWERPELRRVFARRELPTNSGRLDLLLHDGQEEDGWISAGVALLVENKIYHWLANDLGEYWEFINERTSVSSVLGVVLGLKKEIIPIEWRSDWVAITHLEWARAVETRLGSAFYRAEPRYTTLLLELLENIRVMTNADENLKELLNFFQRNRAAISRAETIRNDVFMRFPSAIKSVLEEYEVWWNTGANREGWLIIQPPEISQRPENQQFKYILGYYEVFHQDDVTATYTITLVGENTSDKESLRNVLAATSHSQTHGIKPNSEEQHHVMSKIYPLTSADYSTLPELIAENLRNDWQPLEKYWLNQP